MKVKVAVVGLGKMGLLHASILCVLPDAELVAICERSAFIRRFAQKIFKNVHVVADLNTLTNMQFDAVYVTTPVGSHHPIIMNIYGKGIAMNVFTEKPLASNFSQASNICQQAENTGGIHMVGYHRRLAVTFRKAKEIIDEGQLGCIRSFEGYAYSSDFVEAKSDLQALARGGILRDSGCHIIDLALWFFGDFTVESARIDSILGPNSEDEAQIILRAKNDTIGKINCSWCKKNYRLPETGFSIKGTKGTLRVNEDIVQIETNGGDSSILYRHDLDDDVSFFLGGPEYYREDELFIRSILSGSNVEPSFYTASKVESIMDQVREQTV